MLFRALTAALLLLASIGVAEAQVIGPGGSGLPQPVINGDCIVGSGGLPIWSSCSGTASTAFSALTGGAANTTAAMVVGTGGSLSTTGSGTIAATSAPFSALTTGTNTSATMTLGAGGTLTFASTGIVNANELGGVPLLGGTFTNSDFCTYASSGTLLNCNTGSTGSGSVVLATSPTLTTPALGTPSALVLTNATGLPTAGLNNSAVTYAKIQSGGSNGLLGVNSAAAPSEVAIGSGLSLSAGTLSATGGGSSTGFGVDSGTGAVTVTANCTLGTSAGCSSHSIRLVKIGTLSGAITVTLDAIVNLSTDSVVCVDDGGQNITGTDTLTITANAADAINGGSSGGSIGPYTTSGGSICLRITATHNWTVETSNVIPAVAAISHQWLTSLSSVGTWGQTQPAFTDLSGSASAAQMETNFPTAFAAEAASLQQATSGQFGVVKVDGTTITASSGIITAVGGSATSVTAGTTTVGGTCPSGDNLYNNAGTLGCQPNGGGGGTIIANSIGGLVASNDSSTPNSVLDIASGTAADTTNTVIISPGAFKKSTAGSWVSGSGSNGMGNGLTVAASTLYAVCLANNGGTPDYWFDTSFSCSNRPSGITDTKFRRVASFVTDSSSHILPFFQRNDTIIFKGQYTAAGSPLTFSATPTTLALPVPPFSVATITLYNGNASTAMAMIVYDTDASSTTGSNGNVQCLLETSVSASNSNVCTISVVTDASSTITLVSSGGSTGANIYVNTASFRDMRGQ